MIVKNEYPILEYSTAYEAVINPWRMQLKFPRLCLVTFFEEVFDDVVKKYGGEVLGVYSSEMKDFQVHRIVHKGTELCVVQAVVASGSIGMMTDWLYGQGVEVACLMRCLREMSLSPCVR